MSADLLDTNVFVNLFDNVADAKRERARALVERALTQGNASISYQVIQETLNVVTTRMASPMTADVASEFLRDVLLPRGTSCLRPICTTERWRFTLAIASPSTTPSSWLPRSGRDALASSRRISRTAR